MKPILPVIAAALLAIAPGADTWAKGKPEHAGGKSKGQIARHCPPGLAKKNPPCVPPGLAKKGGTGFERGHDDDHYRHRDDDHDTFERFTRIVDRHGRVIAVGDIVDDGYDSYVVMRDPERYGLPPLRRDELYLRVGDAALQLDRDTRRVLTILALGDLLTR